MIANDNQGPHGPRPIPGVPIVGVVGPGGVVTLFSPLPNPKRKPQLTLVAGDGVAAGGVGGAADPPAP